MPVDGEPAVVETTHEASPVAMETCPEEVQQCGEVAKDGDGKVPGKLLIVWFISNKIEKGIAFHNFYRQIYFHFY